MSIHKATPNAARPSHCFVCGQLIKRVLGGHGYTWIHSDSGAVAAPNPPTATAEARGTTMTATTAKPTPGPWYVSSTGNHQGLVVSEKTGANVAVVYDGLADSPLIAEAGTVYHEIGLTPRQLAGKIVAANRRCAELADALADERKLSTAISCDCNATALDRNEWRDKAGQLADRCAELEKALQEVAVTTKGYPNGSREGTIAIAALARKVTP